MRTADGPGVEPGVGWRPAGLGLPVWLALGVVCGTTLQLQQVHLWTWPAYALPVLVSLVLARWLYRRCPAAAWWLLGCALAFGAAGWRSLDRQADRLDPALWGQEVELTGVVASLPVRGPQGVRWVLAVESAQHRGQPVRVPQRITLSLWHNVRGAAPDPSDPTHPWPDVTVGDRWQLSARLRPVHGLSNPHGGDRELHAWSQGIGAQGSVRLGARSLGPTGQYPLERWRQSTSDRLQQRLADTGHGGVLAALAVGDQDAIGAGDGQ